MNESPAVSPAGQDIELRFVKDWFNSYALILQALQEAPIATAFVATSVPMSICYPNLLFVWLFMQGISWFFLAAKLIRRTYCRLVPLAQDHPEVFSKRPEWQMFGAQWLFNVGTLLCGLLLIIPGIWFAIVHAPAQVVVVLENCTAEKAFNRSRELMKGNFFRFIGYVALWPILISIGLLIGLAITKVIIVLIIKAATQVDLKAQADFLLELFFSYYVLAINLSCITLIVRAYVQFTHKNGSLTAIEKLLTPEIATQ